MAATAPQLTPAFPLAELPVDILAIIMGRVMNDSFLGHTCVTSAQFLYKPWAGEQCGIPFYEGPLIHTVCVDRVRLFFRLSSICKRLRMALASIVPRFEIIQDTHNGGFGPVAYVLDLDNVRRPIRAYFERSHWDPFCQTPSLHRLFVRWSLKWVRQMIKNRLEARYLQRAADPHLHDLAERPYYVCHTPQRYLVHFEAAYIIARLKREKMEALLSSKARKASASDCL